MIRGGAKNDRLVREKEKQKHGRVQEQTAKLTEEVCSTVRQFWSWLWETREIEWFLRLCCVNEDDTKMLQILAWEC